jgi:capsular exopolysaccharide synthesis family protein
MNMNEHVSPRRTLLLESRVARERSSPNTFELHDLLCFLRIHRHVITRSTILVVLLAIALVYTISPIYTADSVVVLDQRKNNVTDATAVLSGLPSDTASVETQIQILTSSELAERVIEKLKLDRDPEFNGKLHPGVITGFLQATKRALGAPSVGTTQDRSVRSEIADKLLPHVQASPVGLSAALKISASDGDPAKAALIANAFASAYVEDQLAAKLEATHKATEWLSARVAELSRRAQQAEAAVQQYKAEHNITTTGNGQSVVDQQIADINGQLVAARAEFGEKRATYGHLFKLSQSGEAANAAPVMASPLIATLRTQQSQLASQLALIDTKYGPRHPKILDLKAEIANLDEKIGQEVQRVVASAKTEMDVSASHVGSLEESLRQAESQGAGQNQASVRLMALQSDAASARAMYEALLQRLNQTQGQEQIETPDARVISLAQVPREPSFPQKMRTILLAVPAGLILGLLIAALMDRLHNGFRTSSQIEAALGVRVLATIPEAARRNSGKLAEMVVKKPLSGYTEAIRGLHIGLAHQAMDRPKRVIAVTSALPGEGKSTLVVSMARLAAERGLKTVMVDLDLRRAQMSKILDQRNARPNLSDLLTGKEPLERCLVKDKCSSAQALVCSSRPSNPAEVLSSTAISELIVRLREKFDVVLLDTPPVLPVSDTTIIGRLADAILVAVRWEKTPRGAVENAMRIVADIGTPIAGVVLMRADSERFRYYTYGFGNYSEYESYYHT